MEREPTPPGRGRQVGRGPKVRAAVLAATLTELAEEGYATLTIDNVARRAGVHKTTIYRRWSDRERLVVDALTDQIAVDIPIPDTGSIATDLRALGRGFTRWATSPTAQALLAALLSDAVRVPEIARAREQIFNDRLRRAEPVVTRAIARGELPATTDAAEVIRTLVAPLYLRLLITGEPLDAGAADQAAERTLALAQAGLLRASSAIADQSKGARLSGGGGGAGTAQWEVD